MQITADIEGLTFTVNVTVDDILSWDVADVTWNENWTWDAEWLVLPSATVATTKRPAPWPDSRPVAGEAVEADIADWAVDFFHDALAEAVGEEVTS